jgi:hypothetical protein
MMLTYNICTKILEINFLLQGFLLLNIYLIIAQGGQSISQIHKVVEFIIPLI